MAKLLADEIRYVRLSDFSGGRNSTISPSLLNANESPTAERVSFDQKGTIRPHWGRKKRYANPFSSSPVTGLGEYRKSNGTTRLLIGNGDKIYYDMPSFVNEWDDFSSWNLSGCYTNSQGNIEACGDIPFSRSSKTYRINSLEVLANTPKFEADGVVIEPSVSNDLPYSNDYNSWTKSYVTITPGQIGPDGVSANASIISDTNTSYLGYIAYTVIPGSAYVSLAIYIKKATSAPSSYPMILIDSSYDTYIQFNPYTGETYTSVSSGGAVHSDVLSVGDYWLIIAKCRLGGSIPSSASLYIYPAYNSTWGTITVSSSATGSIVLGGVSLNASTIAYTSSAMPRYIYTNGSTASSGDSSFKVYVPLYSSGTIDFQVTPYTLRHIDTSVYYGNILTIPFSTNLVVSGDYGSIRVSYGASIASRAVSSFNARTISIAWDTTECVVYLDGTSLLTLSSPGFSGYAGYLQFGGSSYYSGAIKNLKISKVKGSLNESDLIAFYPLTSDLTQTLTPSATSPAVDVTNAYDKSSGYALATATGAVEVSSASAPTADGPWTAFVPADTDGKLLHTPDNFVKIKVEPSKGSVVDKVLLRFDASPQAVLLKDGLTPNSRYCFKTFKDLAIIANGKDALLKWDGTTVSTLGGSPPTFAYIEVHQNRLWGIGAPDYPSRLRYSELLEPENWPALNFIDVSPNDGDNPTGLFVYGPNLIIPKSKKIAVLTGDQTENYAITWIDTNSGVQGKDSITATERYLAFVAQDGIRFSDMSQSINTIERLLADWEKLDKRQLYKSALTYYGHYLLCALCSTEAGYNNEVWIYDSLRNAWTLRKDWAVSCWLKFNEYGEEVLLMGDATTGQVYKVTIEPFNDEDLITYSWKSKDLNFGEPERYKVFPVVFLLVEGESTERTLQVRFYVDGILKGGPILTVPADDGKVFTYRIVPPVYGAVFGQRLAVELIGSNGIQLITIGYILRSFSIGER